MKEALVAYDLNRAIGLHNTLLVNLGDISEDMRRFRLQTIGRKTLMGYNTHLSIGGPLPGRENVVLTSKDIEIPQVTIVHSVDEALEYVGDDFVCIGGSSIYTQFLPHLDLIHATEVQYRFPLADAFFDELDETWQEVAREHFPANQRSLYDLDFVTHARSRPEL